jgi:hypothetical protein
MPPKSRLMHFELGWGLSDLCTMSIYKKMMMVFACMVMVKAMVGQTVLLPVHTVWQYAAGVAGWHENDVFGALRHPAMSGRRPMKSMGLLAESMPGIQGSVMLSSMIGFSVGGGVVGCVLDHRSLAGSGESRLVFGYALPLSPALRVGVRLGIQGFRVPSHRTISGLPVEWGLVYKHGKLSAGVAASHPVTLATYKTHAGIPAIFRVSTTFELSAGTGLALDVVREEGWGISCRPMVFYHPTPAWRLTGGVVVDRGSMFLGMRYARSSMGVHLFFDRHPMLGWTGAFGIDYDMHQEVER